MGTYHCMTCNVVNTCYSQDAQLILSSKQGPGDSQWALGREESRTQEWVSLMQLYAVWTL